MREVTTSILLDCIDKMETVILASGSKGNCVFIKEKNTRILIDFGIRYSTICNKLKELNTSIDEIDYVLITHTHGDHIKGLNVKNIKKLNLFMMPSMAKDIDIDKFNVHFYKKENDMKDITTRVFPTSHDVESVGFIIKGQEKELVYITDTGYVNSRVLPHLKNKDIYIFESNHDIEMLVNGIYPPYLKRRVLSDRGHLSNKLSAEYLSKIIGDNTQYIVLTHLSEKNNTGAKALECLQKELNFNNRNLKKIIVALQEEMSEVIEV